MTASSGAWRLCPLRAGLPRCSRTLPLDEAVEKLWALIFDVCRVSTGDPVGAWQKHVAVTKARRDRMNALELDRIHMTSSNGTDLTVGLADDATRSASSKTEDGIEFIANVPTEEVFCAPHRERTNGIVYGTKPYAYNGQLIEAGMSPSRTVLSWSTVPRRMPTCWPSCSPPTRIRTASARSPRARLQPHQPQRRAVLQHPV